MLVLVLPNKSSGEPEPTKKEQRRANGLPEKKKKKEVIPEASTTTKLTITLPNRNVESIPLDDEDEQLIANNIVKVSCLCALL